MQVISKEGVKVELSAVDADGLDIAVPVPATWSCDSRDISLVVAKDGLSAILKPVGPTVTTELTVSAGGLTVSTSISYINANPVRVPAKLVLAFGPVPADVPAPAPAPAPVAAPTAPPSAAV